MSREYVSILGSGQTPVLALAPVYNFPDGLFPVPSQRESLRARTGVGQIILNPEDFSISIGFNHQAVIVTNHPQPLPSVPLENRRTLVIHNFGPGILYIGGQSVGVNSSNGFPILVNEKIAIDMQGTPGVTVICVSDSQSDVRILELA